MLGGELMDFFLPVSKLETLKQLLPPSQDTNISVALEIHLHVKHCKSMNCFISLNVQADLP